MSNAEPSFMGRNQAGQIILRGLKRNRPVLVAFVVFVTLLGLTSAISPYPLSCFDISFMASGGATTALAAMGQTLVILSGGFDLSAGAVESLVNAVLASRMDPTNYEASVVLWTAVGVGVGMGGGAINVFFIAFLRLQPIVVTLAAMFIIQGLTLLVMGKPGGFVAPSLGGAYMGDAVANVLPASIVMIGVTVLLWLWLKRTPFGLALYAVGSDPEAAEATGLRTHWVVLPPMFWLAGCTGWQGFLSTPKPGRVIRWLVIPCRCQPLRRS